MRRKRNDLLLKSWGKFFKIITLQKPLLHAIASDLKIQEFLKKLIACVSVYLFEVDCSQTCNFLSRIERRRIKKGHEMSALEKEWAYGSSKIRTGKSQEQSGYYGWGGAKTKGSTSNNIGVWFA